MHKKHDFTEIATINCRLDTNLLGIKHTFELPQRWKTVSVNDTLINITDYTAHKDITNLFTWYLNIDQMRHEATIVLLLTDVKNADLLLGRELTTTFAISGYEKRRVITSVA